ncbi:hypothetical protein [Spirosoma luteum]|nr:hypothetical protein [Spirosoma luteum]
MFKIRIIVTTTLTTADVQKATAWTVLVGATALFWYGVSNLVF